MLNLSKEETVLLIHKLDETIQYTDDTKIWNILCKLRYEVTNFLDDYIDDANIGNCQFNDKEFHFDVKLVQS